ncbi:unnamed protein product [Urochloa decumbens]|uniref:Disease resistance protein At4g27190-like leucine-rich repeats domain-containing protein n=1 Tax=Urochloa decumbens TaxID=240449 RepID=A0ABC9BN06_9POAL
MISADDVESAVQQIIPYLEDTSNDALKSVYFDGWFGGLAASAVLRAIAEHPPPSLLEKFDKIIHIDCSRWTSRRALQRAIADELNLTQQVAADFDKQDEEDDFNGVEQGSRAEIAGVARVIAQSIVKYRCLVVFHNGSDGMVDLTNFGIPQPEFFNTKVLWSFRGRFRLNDQICRKVDNSNTHIFLYAAAAAAVVSCSALVVQEAMEIALYTHKLGIDVTPEIATECCMYLLPLNCYGSGFLDYGTLTYNGAAIDYNWATHASSYWVCDGIVQGGQDNRAWELARALQQQMRLDEYSPNRQAGHLGKGNAFVAMADMRFLQSIGFLLSWKWDRLHENKQIDLCFSSTSKKDDARPSYKKKMSRPYSITGRAAAGLPLPKPLVYHDRTTEQQITAVIDGGGCSSSSSSAMQFQPLDFHVEFGEGISDVTNPVSAKRLLQAITYMMDKVESLHVHDSSSITTVTPEHVVLQPGWGGMSFLKWCCVEKCPGLQTVFTITKYSCQNFINLETFWAAHLLMAHSIWRSSPRTSSSSWTLPSFSALRAIHLHFCPRLLYVLTLSPGYKLSDKLETLHILCCGDLRQVFPVEQEFQEKIATSRETRGMLQFPKLKDLYLHDLSSLQLICEVKMLAPNLETIYIRGCWNLRRLPATDGRRRQKGRLVAVDCEKDWWDKLEWDGMEIGHHP